MKKIILLIGLMAAFGTAWASASWEKYYQCLEHNGRRMNMGLLPDIPCGDPPKEPLPARRLVDKPIVTETKEGLIQVEYLHGVNDHVEIMTREHGKELMNQLGKVFGAFIYYPSEPTKCDGASFLVMPSTKIDDAKPAAR